MHSITDRAKAERTMLLQEIFIQERNVLYVQHQLTYLRDRLNQINNILDKPEKMT